MDRQSRQVKAGVGTVEAAQMVDSSPLLLEGQTQAAKERLARDGYLLLRNYLPADRLSKVFPSCIYYTVVAVCARASFPVQAHTFLLDELHCWKPDSCTSQVLHIKRM